MGRYKRFLIYEIEEQNNKRAAIMENTISHHSFLIFFLKAIIDMLCPEC